MKFTALKVVNHHDEVEKALTISQIKELLQYVAETKHAVQMSYLSTMEAYKNNMQKYMDNSRMAETYRNEEQALRKLADYLDAYIG